MHVSPTFEISFSRLLVSAIALVVAGLGVWLAIDLALSHGTCSTHHEYRVYDGTHDGDRDGVGCETLPEPPGGPPSSSSSSSSSSSTQSATGGDYDRDNWSFNSTSARAALMCDSSEHVDHIVALKEAYDSGAATWTNTRKSQFANDQENLWCLDASVNISKSDHDLAEWSGGTCEQRKHIAAVTRTIKAKYSLSTDAAEANANNVALSAQCSTSTRTESTTASDSSTSTSQSTPSQPTPADPQTVDDPGDPFPVGRIVARRLASGSTEFGYRVEDGELVLPSKRFFPTSARVGRWLNSTPIKVDDVGIGRISARLLKSGRIEFSFVPTGGERFLPKGRYFPVSSDGRWLRSTLIDIDS
ncbi:MAG: DUF1524 domain-containing protein [Chloroflexi bacterium]|nr:DUF1524 domain-containing protein [Chloroflexota bacterium]